MKKRRGAAIRPGRQTVRSNSSRPRSSDARSVTPHLPRRRHPPRLPATHPTTHATGAQPHTSAVTSTNPPCLPHTYRRPQAKPPPQQKASNKPMPGGTHCRPQPIKGPLHATPEVTCAEHGTTQSSWERVQKSAVTSAGQPHAEEVPAEELRDRLGDTGSLACGPPTRSRRYIKFIEGKPRQGWRHSLERFGDFYSQFGAVNSPESV